jgi:hypothetical protein
VRPASAIILTSWSRLGGVFTLGLGYLAHISFASGRDFGDKSTYFVWGLGFDIAALRDPVGAILSNSRTAPLGR